MYSPHVVDFQSDLSDICDDLLSGNPTFAPTPNRSMPSTPEYETPPQTPVIAAQTCTTLFTAPHYTGLPAVHARNNDTAVMCGCKGLFFWECLNTHDIAYFRGTSPDSVDRCISSINMYRTFDEAFLEAYTFCIDTQNPCNQISYLGEDFAIAVYQLHKHSVCGKHYTRFTLGSYKKFMQFNEKLREEPVVGTFCRCNVPMTSADIAYTVCFTCLQTTLEMKAQFLPGVLEHFSYEVAFKQGFLNALQKGIRNNTKYFTAQSLFEKEVSKVYKMHACGAYMNMWRYGRCRDHVSWRTLQKTTENQCYCVLCNRPGNGYGCFSCKSCMHIRTSLYY